jgi:hypothetical protein
MRTAPRSGRRLQDRADLQDRPDLLDREDLQAQEDRLHLFRPEGQAGRCRPWDQAFGRKPPRKALRWSKVKPARASSIPLVAFRRILFGGSGTRRQQRRQP